jgi:hypothetical protein
MLFELEMVEGAFAGCGLDDGIAALAAVTAVRSAPGDVAFASKTDATASPVTGLYEDIGFVNKLHAA